MTKAEIMNALNRCEPYVVPACCCGCPYDGCWDTKDECVTQLHSDAFALLKTQEPKPPIIKENSYGWKFYYCPSCEKEFYQNNKFNFCEKCGQAVRWG